jgi:hypothetical protein
MSIFGSREEDPLLQDDPLAPSSEEDAASEDEPSAGDDSSQTSAADTEARSTEEAPDAPDTGAVADSDEEAADESGGHFALDGEGTSRTLVRSLEEAEHGNLTVLNAAFDQGWRIDRVVYQEESDELLFQLQREESRSDRNGVIV